MNGESILWWLAIPAFLAVGCFFLYILYRLRAEQGEKLTPAQKLSEKYGMDRIGRSAEIQHLLWHIGPPECPDGTFSPRQVAMWKHYEVLKAEDVELTEAEMKAVVNAGGRL